MSTLHYLSQHIFLCPTNDEIVLLDIKHDRYLALNTKQAYLLREFLQGWPDSKNHCGKDPAPISTEAAALAQLLKEKELVTEEEKFGKPVSSPAIDAPANGIFKAPLPGPIEVKLRHLLALASSVVFSAALLRWRPIEKVVAHVSGRRSARRVSDLQTARGLVAIFFRLRPFLFRSNNACLFDSLALINFLAWFGVFPQWVFGVRNDPFAAHCWVQQDETVFNDSVEHVVRYTPIMVV